MVSDQQAGTNTGRTRVSRHLCRALTCQGSALLGGTNRFLCVDAVSQKYRWTFRSRGESTRGSAYGFPSLPLSFLNSPNLNSFMTPHQIQLVRQTFALVASTYFMRFPPFWSE